MKLYRTLLQDFKEMSYAYMTLGIILSSCLGSAAAMVILMNGYDFVQMIQLFLVVSVCMGYNATVLANMRPKFVFNALLLSVIMSTILLIINIAARY